MFEQQNLKLKTSIRLFFGNFQHLIDTLLRPKYKRHVSIFAYFSYLANLCLLE